VQSDEEAIDVARRYMRYFPNHCDNQPEVFPITDPAKEPTDLARIIPTDQNVPFDMFDLIERIVDADSFLEIKALFARELITGLARIGGRVVGIVANQPKIKGGVLFVDSADKGARFIALCDAFNIPLLFLADVPGFMIGSKVERQGIIRHGAKMIYAVSEATVPKISVIVRKVYGAGLYAMCGPAYGADATLALPTAYIAVMGPEAAVNAVYYNKIMELHGEEREHFVRERREEYRRDIDLYKLASRLIVDAVVPPSRLREELMSRFAAYASKHVTNPCKRHGVRPV
jgi:acetyl-CoA carboxylase carboxyltransferase component